MMSFARNALALALLLPAATSAAWAQAGKERAVGFGNFGSSKEPIKIDANKLEVFDREGRAVFSGDVVAVQGESTMKCTAMTVFYEQQNREGSAQPAAATTTGQGPSESAIKKIDCKGPVTIVSRTQVATGDNATFDRGANKILLNGNAALSDGPNVTRGERVVYDINTGVASIDTKPGGRVRALFVPGSGGPAPTGAGNAKPKP